MNFVLPSLDNLIQFCKKLTESYPEAREKLTATYSYVGQLFRGAFNQERIDTTAFAKTIAISVSQRKEKYHELDKFFPDYDSRNSLLTSMAFLKKVIAGALLMELAEITATYSDEKEVKNRSALAKLILDFFGIDKLSDMPVEDRNECLESLKRYMTTVTTKMPETIAWHPSKSIDEIYLDIDKALGVVVEEEALSSPAACSSTGMYLDR